jgi:mannose-6-phosphate isomerase-like protein (cupin superfamily)
MALRLRALTVGAPADEPRRQTDGGDNGRRQDLTKAGDTIENPLSGERITFLEVPSETNGDLLRFDWRIPPGFSIPEHLHLRQEERHEILSGTLRGRVAGREQDYGQDHRVTGPPGVPHAWRNPSDDEELRILSELQPALGFESLLETSFAIARDLKTDRLGTPKHLLRIFILLDEAGGEIYPAGVPMRVWRAFLALVAAIARAGRLLGYEAHSPVRRPTGVRSRVAVVLAAGLAGTVVFALLRRRNGNRRIISG